VKKSLWTLENVLSIIVFILSNFTFSQSSIFDSRIKVFKNEDTLTDLFENKTKDQLIIEICFSDSLTFVAAPIFKVNGVTEADCSYEWNVTGQGFKQQQSFVFKPTNKSGFYISLVTTDPSKQSDTISSKVRVSAIPNFTSFQDIPNVLCMDNPVNISFIKGDGTDETSPIKLKKSFFNLGGLFKAETKLPDGSGISYDSKITIDDFGNNAIITSSKDIEQMCVSMEHSFLGDLEMKLTCPTGKSIILVNSYQFNNGMIPGGFNGKDISLGNDLEIDNGPQGSPSWQYCFSSDNFTYGTMGDELMIGNTIPNIIDAQAMNPNGIYIPEESFSKFNGCPVKGDWTLTIRDNSESDDGYIFNWGILFNAESFPFLESYQNTITDQGWKPDNAIQEFDTNIVITPKILGHNEYKYFVTTNFGCNYDTIIQINTELCLTIPNILIVNSKVGNDKFFINTGDVKEFSCKIYNRWGNLIYAMTDVHDSWDGKNKHGRVVDEGTYYYIAYIKYNNESEAKREGFITVQH
jgi:gliding motility-associated-like protein